MKSYSFSPISSPDSKVLKIGVKCFISGYILTEVLLFLQGCFFFLGEGSIPGYFQSILIFSLFLVLGLILIRGVGVEFIGEQIEF